MCVLALNWKAHPDWLLVAAGNRDEFHGRPALPLGPWDDMDGMVAGRDARAGGTWLGVFRPENGESRFAVVTNVRDPAGPDPAKLSRGTLVTDLLTGKADTAAIRPEAYNPFNLLLVQGTRSAHMLTNRPLALVQSLEPGVHGLSNGVMDAPWPKTYALQDAVAAWTEAGTTDMEPLFAALANETRFGPRNSIALPGEGQEPRNSPMFIRSPVYGTRCSTVVTVDGRGRGCIAERRFDSHGRMTGTSRYAFAWA